MASNCAKALDIPIPTHCKVKVPSILCFAHRECRHHQQVLIFKEWVHRSICLELHGFIDRILHIILAIESARPNCALAIQTLCSLHFTLDKAKSIVKLCSQSSKLYLAITSHKILSRCEKIRNAFELYLAPIQNTVPIPLAAKISAILHDLRDTKFLMEFAEDEARKVVLALLDKNFPSSASMENAELEAIQIATLKLEINSPFSLLVEKATLKRQLDHIQGTHQKEKELLKYLLYLLIKYEKFIWQFQNESLSLKRECHDQSFVNEAICENQVNDSIKPKVRDLGLLST